MVLIKCEKVCVDRVAGKGVHIGSEMKIVSENGWLYYPDFDNTCRYILGQPGKKTLCCFGINPSTAEPNNLDNTVRSVASLSEKKGFDGWIMLNVYPQRATNPNDMHEVLDTTMHERNVKHIAALIEQYENLVFWAAWGTIIQKRSYLFQCLLDIYGVTTQSNIPWITIGKRSKVGHPHHPLYLNHNSTSEDFDIARYVEEVGSKS